MGGYTTTRVSQPAFVADPHSIILLGSGRQIDWANVDVAFKDAVTGKKRLPAGVIVKEASANGPLQVNDAGLTPLGMLATDAVEDAPEHAKSGYGVIVGGVIYSNLLPATPLASAEVNDITKLGDSFIFQTYADDRTT